MKKGILLGCLILLWILTGCTDENIEDMENDETVTVTESSSHKKKEKKEKKSDKKEENIESQEQEEQNKVIIANYENGYTLLQPGEMYYNEVYQIKMVNKGETVGIVSIIDGPEQRFFELYKICPKNLEGYDINLQYFINNDTYKDVFSLEGEYRIRPIKTFISEKNIESMKVCLMGQNEGCMSENKAVPYFVSDEEKSLCEGKVSMDPLCEKYNRLVEKYGRIE